MLIGSMSEHLQTSDSNTCGSSTRSTRLVELLLCSNISSVERENATQEFLIYIYEQIDNLLSRCTPQSSSRSNTPLSLSAPGNITPPVYTDKTQHSQTSVNHSLVPTDGATNRSSNGKSSRPRRVQLFSSTDKSESQNSAGHYNNASHTDLHNGSTNHSANNNNKINSYGYHSTHSSNSKSLHNGQIYSEGSKKKSSKSDFSPLQSSTPSHSHHRLPTLADFVTPDHRKKRNKGKPSLRPATSAGCNSLSSTVTSAGCNSLSSTVTSAGCNSLSSTVESKESSDLLNSFSCGSWALDVGEQEITPLKPDTQPEIGLSTSNGAVLPSCSWSLNEGTVESHYNESAFSGAGVDHGEMNGITVKHSGTEQLVTQAIVGSKCIETPSIVEPTLANATTGSQRKGSSKAYDGKPSRRITPTVVSCNSRWREFKQQAVFVPQSPKKPASSAPPDNYTEERQRLKEKKAQLMVPIGGPGEGAIQLNAVTPSKTSCMRSDVQQCVQPQPELVTHRYDINRAAHLFAQLITGW